MMNDNKRHSDILRKTVRAAIIAALYSALTLVLYPLSFGAVQFRFSEALTALPIFFPEAIAGLFVGCIITNIATPNALVLDLILGSLATLLAAFLTRALRKNRFTALLPPVILNTLAVPAVIALSSSEAGSAGFVGLWLAYVPTVFIGEAAVCYALGLPLTFALEKLKNNGIYPFSDDR